MIKYQFSSFLKKEMNLYAERRKTEVEEATLIKDILALRSFDEYICRNAVTELNIDSVSGWILALPDVTNKTLNRYICNIRVFLKYLSALHGRNYYIPEFKSEEDEYEPYYFTKDEKDDIYEIIDNWIPGRNNKLPWISIELPMIIRILDGCGTRVEEVLRLRMQDIDVYNGIIIMRDTKNKRGRRVPMSENLSTILSNYCRAMGIWGIPQSFLFPRSTINEHAEVHDIYKRFRNVLIRLGIRKPEDLKKHERGPCLYNLRHTFIYNRFLPAIKPERDLP